MSSYSSAKCSSAAIVGGSISGIRVQNAPSVDARRSFGTRGKKAEEPFRRVGNGCAVKAELTPHSLMAINLTKGQTIDLRKGANGLDHITIGLGWNVREKKKGFLGVMFGGKDEAVFDLDAIDFLLDENGKLQDRRTDKLVEGDIVFFNSRQHPSGTVINSGDSRMGGTGTDDDEQIIVKFNSMPAKYHCILFLVCIYQGIKQGQHFGQVESAYISAGDGSSPKIAHFSPSSKSPYDGKFTMVFGELYRRTGGWKFRAIRDAHPYDSFVHLLKDHLLH